MPLSKISNQDLLEEYSVNHLSVSEIMRKYGYADHTAISTRLTKLGLPSKRHHQMNIEITQRQRELLFGSLLGDATVRKNTRNCYFKFSHSSKQSFYVNWKHSELLPFSRHINTYTMKDGVEHSEFITSTLPQFNEFRGMFYSDLGVKFVPEDLSLLTPLALSVWLMDDGGHIGDNRVSFATCSFTELENEMLSDYLLYHYNLLNSLCWIGGHKYRVLVISAKSIHNLREIVLPHLLDGFRYKVNC